MASTERESSGQSRRERRRAQKDAKVSPQKASTVESDIETTGEEIPDSQEDPSDDQASASDVGEPTEPVRPQRIKDRNKRLRAEAAERRQARQVRVDGPGASAGLDASERVDDVLVRFTHGSASWLRKNAGFIQGLLVVGLVGGIGWKAYNWNAARKNAAASEILMQGVHAQDGMVMREEEPLPKSLADLKRTFANDPEQVAAVQQGYEKALDTGSKGVTELAKLGLAGNLLAAGKYEEARAAYETLKTSWLAAHDADAKGRILEGIAISLEGKGDLDAAEKAYRELENAGLAGTASLLGMYHQARLLLGKGETDKAKELLTKLKEKLKENKELPPNSYLRKVAGALLRSVDPTAPNDELEQIDDARLQELLQKLKQANPQGMPTPTPGAPTPQAPSGNDAPPPEDDAP